MTALEDCVSDLAAVLPRAEALITQPDTQAHTGRGQPSSRPPWNAQAAMALLDALEGARRLEASWRTGALRPMSATGTVLQSIVRLSYAVTEDEQRHAVILVTRWTTAILRLPAVDKAEKPLLVPGECPYCHWPMMCAYLVSGRVACVRAQGGCQDANGDPPRGYMGHSDLDGSPCIKWDDGLVT